MSTLPAETAWTLIHMSGSLKIRLCETLILVWAELVRVWPWMVEGWYLYDMPPI